MTFDPSSRFGLLWCLPMIISYYFVVPVFSTLITLCGKYWWIPNTIALLWALHKTSHQTKMIDGIPISDITLHLPTFVAASTFAIFYLRIKTTMNSGKNSIMHKKITAWLARITSSLLVIFLGCIFMDRTLLLEKIHFFTIRQGDHSTFLILNLILLELLYPSWITNYTSFIIMKYLGKMAYPISLIHVVIFQLIPCSQNICRDGLDITIYVTTFSIFVSGILHFFVERPLLNMASRIERWLSNMETGPYVEYIPLSHNGIHKPTAKLGIKGAVNNNKY